VADSRMPLPQRSMPTRTEAPTLIYAVRRFGLALPALAAAMHLILPDGRVFSGADAVPELGRLLPGKRWWAWGFAVPGVRPVARRVYARIARGRRCAVRGLPASELPEQIGGGRKPL
jgi:predicted DCC family thiol-disulfide oxidoreductase YuxK